MEQPMVVCYKYWCVFRLRKTLKTAAAAGMMVLLIGNSLFLGQGKARLMMVLLVLRAA